jgi:hypothetical protein
LREFKEIEISRQSGKCDCEKQGEKLLRLLSGFRPRIQSLESEGEGRGRGGREGGNGSQGIETDILSDFSVFTIFPCSLIPLKQGHREKKKARKHLLMVGVALPKNKENL